MKLGKIFKRIREDRGYTQEEVSSGINISRSYLSVFESGEKDGSSLLWKSLCGFYGVNISSVVWDSLEDKDVPEGKREAFRTLKSTVGNLIKDITEE